MHHRYFWKKFPFPVQWLRPWVLVSLALHAVVLGTPLLPNVTPTLPELEETVSVAPTPLRSPPLAPPAPAIPSPPVVAAATPQPGEVPAQIPAPSAVRRSASSAVIPPSTSPRAVAPPASPSPRSAPQSIAPSTPVPIVSPSPTRSPSAASAIASPSPEVATPYANFPHIESTTTGCGGRENCWQSGDTRFRTIADTLEQDLQEQGYSVSLVDLGTDAGVLVYRVSKVGEPEYYLNLTSTFEQGTVYLISEQPMTAVEIRQEAERKDEGWEM